MVIAFLILAFTFTDTATTLFGLNFIGGTELNPIYHAIGPAAFWLFKWVWAVVYAAVSWKARDYLPKQWHIVLWGGALIPALASLSNAIGLLIWSWGLV